MKEILRDPGDRRLDDPRADFTGVPGGISDDESLRPASAFGHQECVGKFRGKTGQESLAVRTEVLRIHSRKAS